MATSHEKALKEKHVPKKAPSWSSIMKNNPNVTRDSKGNVMGKPKQK